jgi:hypothetical protein
LDVEGGLAVTFSFQPLATAFRGLYDQRQWGKNGGENNTRQKKQGWMGHVFGQIFNGFFFNFLL